MKEKNLKKNTQFEIISADSDQKIKDRLKVLIETVPLAELSEFIDTEVKNELTLTEFRYDITCFRADGAYALYRAINEIQGYSSQSSTGPSNDPPQTLDIQITKNTSVKVPWGRIKLPNMGDKASISMGYYAPQRLFSISGQCEKRYMYLMDNIVRRTREIVETDSIYKGQAFKLDAELNPTFLDLDKYKDMKMYMSDKASFELRPIVARIEKTQRCIDAGMDISLGALLSGDYGTGKTLLAFKLGNLALQHGWTFIYLTAPEKTVNLLEIAGQMDQNGPGVLVFVEDINLVVSGDRNAEMNKILNELDGGESKGSNIISIFTTNHLEKIDPTFLRGKRIGSLITLGALDAKTADTFIRDNLGASLKDSEDITEAVNLIQDLEIVPAFLSEILEKCKANMLYADTEFVTNEDLIASTQSYKEQMALAKVARNEEESEADKLFKALRNATGPTPELTQAVKDLQEWVDNY